MGPKYRTGDRVIISPRAEGPVGRGGELKPFAGQYGRVVEFYYLNMNSSADTVFMYVVRLEKGNKRLVLHEDELESLIPV